MYNDYRDRERNNNQIYRGGSMGVPGKFNLTRDEYLEKRRRMSRAEIAREHQITYPSLLYHLKKWGLSDGQKELLELDGLKYDPDSDSLVKAYPPETKDLNKLAEFFTKTDSTKLSDLEDVSKVPVKTTSNNVEAKSNQITNSIELNKDRAKSTREKVDMILERIKGLQSLMSNMSRDLMALHNEITTLRGIDKEQEDLLQLVYEELDKLYGKKD